MIAAGTLSAGLASYLRRNPGFGFLVGSCATLGLTKIYYGAAGLPMTWAAGETGLTAQSAMQAGLNSFYFLTDFAQCTLPLAGAWLALRKRAGGGEPPALKDLLQAAKPSHLPRFLWDEACATVKSLPEVLSPRGINLYLLGLPLAAGVYQMLTSDLDSLYKVEGAQKMMWELSTAFAAALIHDRMLGHLHAPESVPTRAAENPPAPEELQS